MVIVLVRLLTTYVCEMLHPSHSWMPLTFEACIRTCSDHRVPLVYVQVLTVTLLIMLNNKYDSAFFFIFVPKLLSQHQQTFLKIPLNSAKCKGKKKAEMQTALSRGLSTLAYSSSTIWRLHRRGPASCANIKGSFEWITCKYAPKKTFYYKFWKYIMDYILHSS